MVIRVDAVEFPLDYYQGRLTIYHKGKPIKVRKIAKIRATKALALEDAEKELSRLFDTYC